MAENMDIFSLEDDDCIQLFITQLSQNDSGFINCANDSNNQDKSEKFIGLNPTDFTSLVTSLLHRDSVYSDISDDDEFILPLSQKMKSRYVQYVNSVYYILVCNIYCFFQF